MNVVTDFPHSVRILEHEWIPLADGTRLAARIWLPHNAMNEPAPALLEYIPYRKRDLTRGRDAMNHPYFAGHGYACVRVDLRGSGDSEGVLQDQFLEQEQTDGLEVLAWIAKQPWCNGKVAMFGISWGGFAALQIAARRPPALKAIVVASATDDLYVDNMHYMGGCLLGDNLSEATTMAAFNSCPPDPELVGERWRQMWLDRLDGSGMWLETWLEHQHHDAYWDVGSVRREYDAIECPVLCASGWADGYTNAVFRLLEHLKVPRRGLIGPWSHKYPHLGVPGPAIGFLQETLRWLDRWLRDIDNGVENEPTLRVWMQDSVPPRTAYRTRPGRWVAERQWPSPNLERRTWSLKRGLLVQSAPGAVSDSVSVQSPLSVGLFAGKWCSYAATPDLPGDQRSDDGGSLIFETEPLRERLEILGQPIVELDVSANRPVAQVAVRVSDVLPDGKVTRVTYGLLNLTHREGHAQPAALVPDRRYQVQVSCNGAAHSFPAGHRIRVSISTSYWPLAWPPPEPTEVTIHLQSSQLILPVRRPRPEDDAALAAFPPAEIAPPIEQRVIAPGRENWRVIHDLASDEACLEVVRHDGHFAIDEIELEVQKRTREWYRSQGDNFNSISGETRTLRAFKRGDWNVRATTHTLLTADADSFHLSAELDAFEGKRRVFSRTWNRRIRRKLV